MKAAAPERRRSARSDEATPAVVSFLLLGEPLGEAAAQLFHVEGLDERALFRGELGPPRHVGEPRQDLLGDLVPRARGAAKVPREGEVERVEVRFAMNQDRAREKV